MLSKPLKLALFLTVALGAGCSSVRTYPETAKAAETFAVSDADPEIKSALDYINKAPDSTLGYQQLAITYIKRARLTGDFSLNRKAETAVKKALEISPDDINVQKLNASLQLTFHRFDEALALATEMQKANPTDAFVFGVMTDANVELGNYDAAVAAAQKMVDLRPNSASYARVAHIRAINGDHTGAVEMFKLAARTADPSDKEAQSCVSSS